MPCSSTGATTFSRLACPISPPQLGGLVIIEHQLSDGTKFCSLYAHLGALVAAKSGEHISAGRKLADPGRSNSWKNGGYTAHLHFGIHMGAFGNGDWITGYMGKEHFHQDEHGWVEPQAFIKKHMK